MGEWLSHWSISRSTATECLHVRFRVIESGQLHHTARRHGRTSTAYTLSEPSDWAVHRNHDARRTRTSFDRNTIDAGTILLFPTQATNPRSNTLTIYLQSPM